MSDEIALRQRDTGNSTANVRTLTGTHQVAVFDGTWFRSCGHAPTCHHIASVELALTDSTVASQPKDRNEAIE